MAPRRVFILLRSRSGSMLPSVRDPSSTRISRRGHLRPVSPKVLKQGNEYIREYSQDQKDEIVRNILLEFTKHQTFLGNRAEHKIDGSRFEIHLHRGDRDLRIIYCREIRAAAPCDALISLSRMSEETIQDLVRNDKIWFDLEGKISSFHRDPLWSEIRDFLSRYGIRFDVQS